MIQSEFSPPQPPAGWRLSPRDRARLAELVLACRQRERRRRRVLFAQRCGWIAVACVAAVPALAIIAVLWAAWFVLMLAALTIYLVGVTARNAGRSLGKFFRAVRGFCV